jgi:hypothetical protein
MSRQRHMSPIKWPPVAACHPRPLGVAVRHPRWLGAARPPSKGWPSHPFQLFFFVFFFLNLNFIYFLINLYFFIKMDTCRHLIGDTWYLTESVKNFNRIWQQGSSCNYCIPQGPLMHFLNYKEWKIIMAYHIDQRCNYPYIYIYIYILMKHITNQLNIN